MKQFLKYVLATLTGLILFCLLTFFLFAVMLGSAFKKEVVEVKSNSVLKIEFKMPIAERSDNNPFRNLNLSTLKASKKPGLNDIVANIEKAEKDDNIKGILLNLNYFEAGYATTTEIRNALVKFKKSGKFIFAYAEYYSTKAYYLASVADKIYVHPEGAVDFKGLFTQMMFMKLPLVATNELATETKDKVSSSVEIRKGLRILLAEDNQFNQMVAEDTLRMVIPDLTLDIVDNGVQAIEKLTSGNYDLVILDIHMPEMDGYETTQFIRTQMPSPLNGVPIMAMTANVISEEIDKCFAVGMNAYVSKPFTHEDLFDKIKSLTSK